MKHNHEESERPLVMGGQGRTDSNVEADGTGLAVVFSIAALILIVVLACQ